jgi:AcrR family transcriptional regulator
MSSSGGRSRISQRRSTKNKKDRTLRVRNRGARERALIEAAAKLFADQGYEHTTTREIAAKAGCAEGLISRYFQGKAGLLKKLIELQVSRAQAISPPFPATIQEEIRRLVHEEVDRFVSDREFMKMIVPQIIIDPSLGQHLSQISDQRTQTIVDRLRNYKETASFSIDELIAFALALTGIGSVLGFWRPVALGLEGEEMRKTTTSMAEILSRIV